MTSRLYLAQVRLLCIVVLGIHLAPVSGLPFATTVPARLIAEQRALADPVHAFYTFSPCSKKCAQPISGHGRVVSKSPLLLSSQ